MVKLVDVESPPPLIIAFRSTKIAPSEANVELAERSTRNTTETDRTVTASLCPCQIRTIGFPSLDFVYLIVTLLILAWILALQILSVIYAQKGILSPPITVEWYSPLSLHEVAVQTGQHTVFLIRYDAKKGIGCIQLPAMLQSRFLYAIFIFVIISPVLELLDLAILLGVNSKYRILGGAKLKRPWLTMTAGIAALIVVGVFSIMLATSLPVDVTRNVLLAASMGEEGFTLTVKGFSMQGRFERRPLHGWMGFSMVGDALGTVAIDE